MKKLITPLTILFCTVSLLAQNVTFDLRWNASSSVYEFYVTRDITAVGPLTTGGTAAVTIVFPTDVSNTRTLSHTSESVSTFNPSGVIRSPAASADNDFYVFNSVGGSSYVGILNANVEVLWMTFTPSDGNSAARLFINDIDPSSSDAGMMGIDARSEFNTITTAGLVDEFSGNVLSVQTNELLELSIYPNPASDKIYIVSNNTIDNIEVYDILGKRVITLKNVNEMDVSKLNSGLYLLKIWTGKQVQTKKLVIN